MREERQIIGYLVFQRRVRPLTGVKENRSPVNLQREEMRGRLAIRGGRGGIGDIIFQIYMSFSLQEEGDNSILTIPGDNVKRSVAILQSNERREGRRKRSKG
jgi:hypothetical protein